MMKKIFSVLIVFCFLFLAGCVEDTSPDKGGMPAVEEVEDVSQDEINGTADGIYNEINLTGPKTVIVYLENYRFDPYLVTISTGDTVKWVKKDHPAQIIKGNIFQSPTLREGDTYSFTFEQPGNYDYQIVTHPWTPGGIVVVE